MVLSWSRFKQSARELPSVMREYLALFICMHVLNLFFNQLMIYLQGQRMTTHDDIYVPAMLIIAFIGFIVQSIIKTVWTFVVCHFFRRKKSLGDFLRHNLEHGVIESLRAFFRAILWGFLFIFPGFHKIIQYQFVVFIVGLDDEYDAGKRDALATSVQLTRGHTFAVGVLITVFAILTLMTTTGYFIFSNPLHVLTVELVSFVLITWETIYLLHLFEDLKKLKGLA